MHITASTGKVTAAVCAKYVPRHINAANAVNHRQPTCWVNSRDAWCVRCVAKINATVIVSAE